MAEHPGLEELRRELDRNPDSRLFAQLAEELRRRGELSEAIRVAREGLGRHPDFRIARISLGQALLDSGDTASARREFETVLRDAPDDVLTQRLLRQCLEAPGGPGAAVVHSDAVLPTGSAGSHPEVPIEQPRRPLSVPVPAENRRSAAPPGSTQARPASGSRRLSLRADEPGSGRPGAGDDARDPDVLYVDFSDEGPVAPAKNSPIIESLGDPESVAGEALRLLGARVQKLRRDRKISCLAITSALPGEGKSAIALGLAGALAREDDQRVLLVEADLRRPSLVPTLGLPPNPGLSEWLKGEIAYVPVSVVEPGGFFVLAAGPSGLDRPEVLGSQRMDALLRAARSLFDFVLLDAVPVMSVSDAVLIQDLVDGFLLVVRSRRTPRDAVHDALGALRADKVLGVVLNDHDEYKDSYRSYAYGRYGMGGRSRRGSGGGARRPASRRGRR